MRTITCFPHDGWAAHPQPDEPGLNILTAVVNGFLSHENCRGSGKFIWEHHFKLTRVSVIYQTWEIASKFGKPTKGMKKAGKIARESDEKRQVLYREISGTFPMNIHVGYDPNFAWVEKVAKDLA
jgi:hypothetical protein